MAVGRRRFMQVAAAAAAWAPAGFTPGPAVTAQERNGGLRWVGTWATAPVAELLSATNRITNQTLRQIVHVSVGGRAVRVRLANTFGTEPLDIGAAHIALRAAGAAIVPGSGRTLYFGGSGSIRIAAGATVVSDTTDLAIPPLSDVAIDLYLPGESPFESPHTFHPAALQTNYVTGGNSVGVADLPGAAPSLVWYFLQGVEVLAATPTGAVVTLGDSITDGTPTTAGPITWPGSSWRAAATLRWAC
jgi:hypothetical protein